MIPIMGLLKEDEEIKVSYPISDSESRLHSSLESKIAKPPTLGPSHERV